MNIYDSTHHFQMIQKKKELVDRCPQDCLVEQRMLCGQFGLQPEYCAVIRHKMEKYMEELDSLQNFNK